MKRWIPIVSLVATAALAQEKQMTTFNFDSDTAGQAPKGFEFALTGQGQPGKWVVQAVALVYFNALWLVLYSTANSSA